MVGDDRANTLKKRGIVDQPDLQLVFALMFSHEPPLRKGEFFEIYNRSHCTGTLLDTVRTIYVSYDHFDAVFLPGGEMTIYSAKGPYLGRVPQEIVTYYFRQFIGVQKVIRGQGFKLGSQFSLPFGVQRR